MEALVLYHNPEDYARGLFVPEQWALWVDGKFIGSTTSPETAELYEKIKDVINAS